MWLCNSSIGRKVIMSVSGMALILFLTFHRCMNVVAVIDAIRGVSGDDSAYNMICGLLGSNWYAVAATIALAALVVIHIAYAFILEVQNKKARGNNKYAVTSKPEKVEWASQNMLVLGLIVLLGLLLHLFNFWYNMMFAELIGQPTLGGHEATDGLSYIKQTFACPVYSIIYIVWLVAIWFHLTHGMWSAMQTMGWSGHIWFKRWKLIGNIYSTLIMLLFLVVVVYFWLFSGCTGGSCC